MAVNEYTNRELGILIETLHTKLDALVLTSTELLKEQRKTNGRVTRLEDNREYVRDEIKKIHDILNNQNLIDEHQSEMIQKLFNWRYQLIGAATAISTIMALLVPVIIDYITKFFK